MAEEDYDSSNTSYILQDEEPDATFLSANSQIKTIVLHLDNDKVGRLCTATLKELLQKDYKIVDDPPPVGKDFNDFLLSYLKIARPKLKRERSDVR